MVSDHARALCLQAESLSHAELFLCALALLSSSVEPHRELFGILQFVYASRTVHSCIACITHTPSAKHKASKQPGPLGGVQVMIVGHSGLSWHVPNVADLLTSWVSTHVYGMKAVRYKNILR